MIFSSFNPSLSLHPDSEPLITQIILIMNIRGIRGNQWKPACPEPGFSGFRDYQDWKKSR